KAEYPPRPPTQRARSTRAPERFSTRATRRCFRRNDFGAHVTLIAVWSEDPKTHLYLATDSRLSDVGGAGTSWDRACKIFQMAHLPEVVAYCGKTEPLLVAITQAAQCLRYTDTLSKAGDANAPQLTARVSAACTHLDDAIKSY